MSVLKVGIDMKKDNKDYPKDIDKKSWDTMTSFTLNILSLLATLTALGIILGVVLIFHRFLT
jgi:hypothetical protein